MYIYTTHNYDCILFIYLYLYLLSFICCARYSISTCIYKYIAFPPIDNLQGMAQRIARRINPVSLGLFSLPIALLFTSVRAQTCSISSQPQNPDADRSVSFHFIKWILLFCVCMDFDQIAKPCLSLICVMMRRGNLRNIYFRHKLRKYSFICICGSIRAIQHDDEAKRKHTCYLYKPIRHVSLFLCTS